MTQLMERWYISKSQDTKEKTKKTLLQRRSQMFSSFVAGDYQIEETRQSIIEALANLTKAIYEQK